MNKRTVRRLIWPSGKMEHAETDDGPVSSKQIGIGAVPACHDHYGNAGWKPARIVT
jgi:hypothetical protein